MKKIGSKGLAILKSEGESFNFARRLSADTLAKVDPLGIHILSALIFNNPSDLAIVPHHRCWVYLKMVDSDEPLVLEVDIAITSYDILREVEYVG